MSTHVIPWLLKLYSQIRLQFRQQNQKFETAARRTGQEFERLGLSEEEVMAQLEETKQQTYEVRYGTSQS